MNLSQAILLDILRILSKLMNFRVAKMCGNNGMFHRDICKNIYRHSSHKALVQLEVTFTGNHYCKGSITNVGTINDNEANFLPLPYKQFIVLPPGSITA